MSKFTLKCISCGKICSDGIFCQDHNSLIRTEYKNKKFIYSEDIGIWKYKSWLPCYNTFIDGEAPITYKSVGIAKLLNLDNLYISFNGYWPEKGAKLQTCSFKDLESSTTIQRLLDNSNKNEIKKPLVVASAGNTARAFLYICIKYKYPLIVFIPQSSENKLWVPKDLKYDLNETFPLIISIDGDYADAIRISNELTDNIKNYISEGGAKNISRRDGMGTIILDATKFIGKIPDYYIQAAGSGTGGIAAYEASLRLIEDGNYGNKIPKIYLIQNIPCAPLIGLMSNLQIDENCPDNIVDDVLFNRYPPYNICGGVKDVLNLSKGNLLGATKKEVEFAKVLFEKEENIDISYASAVSVAGLLQMVRENVVKKEETILLNITSGGLLKYKEKYELDYIKPKLHINSELKIGEIIDLINNYIKINEPLDKRGNK